MSAAGNNVAGDALVVGASRGVGLALAEALATRPAPPGRLFVTHRGDAVPGTLAALAAGAPGNVVPVRCDVTDDGDLDALARTLADNDARLGLTVHAAGILHEPGLRPEKALRQVDREDDKRTSSKRTIRGPAAIG